MVTLFKGLICLPSNFPCGILIKTELYRLLIGLISSKYFWLKGLTTIKTVAIPPRMSTDIIVNAILWFMIKYDEVYICLIYQIGINNNEKSYETGRSHVNMKQM